MTRVDFHSQIADKTHYACRLIRKARAAHCRIVVLGDSQQVDQLDQALWQFSEDDFIAHCWASDARASHAPVLLISHMQQTQTLQAVCKEILINLGQSFPEGFESFQRVIELVSNDNEDAQAGRRRFREYQNKGISPEHLAVRG